MAGNIMSEKEMTKKEKLKQNLIDVYREAKNMHIGLGGSTTGRKPFIFIDKTRRAIDSYMRLFYPSEKFNLTNTIKEKFSEDKRSSFNNWKRTSDYQNSIERLKNNSPVKNEDTGRDIPLNDINNLEEVLLFAVCIEANSRHNNWNPATISTEKRQMIIDAGEVLWLILFRLFEEEETLKNHL